MPTDDPSGQGAEGERSGSFVSGKVSSDPVVVRTARNVRRVGSAIALVGIAITTIPVTIGVVGSVMRNEVVDPYSGRALEHRNSTRESADCTAWGMDLVRARERGQQDAADLDAWWARCGEPSLVVPKPESQLEPLRHALRRETAPR